MFLSLDVNDVFFFDVLGGPIWSYLTLIFFLDLDIVVCVYHEMRQKFTWRHQLKQLLWRRFFVEYFFNFFVHTFLICPLFGFSSTHHNVPNSIKTENKFKKSVKVIVLYLNVISKSKKISHLNTHTHAHIHTRTHTHWYAHHTQSDSSRKCSQIQSDSFEFSSTNPLLGHPVILTMIWLILILIGTILYFIPNKKPYAGVYTRPGKGSFISDVICSYKLHKIWRHECHFQAPETYLLFRIFLYTVY